MGAYVNVSDADFQSEVLESDLPVLVDFWAPWCGPCRAIAPHVETLATKYAGKLKVAKVNVDDNQRIAGQLGIRGIPAIMVFHKGQVANQMTGMPPNPLAKLESLVQGLV
ncbi:MAG: thioredoxin [Myxococcales bacterium]|jgi:thioredoxin 1|nr:thioredoxin [Myxococcales bacterium]